MVNSSSLVIIQKYILLATGMQSSVALRDKIVELHEQTDDLDQIAELADTFMTELAKNSDYNSSQTAAAAREWLANIRATDKSLATGTEAIQGLIDSFIDVDSAATIPLLRRTNLSVVASPSSSSSDDSDILII